LLDILVVVVVVVVVDCAIVRRQLKLELAKAEKVNIINKNVRIIKCDKFI
jgi:hypothetical protein